MPEELQNENENSEKNTSTDEEKNGENQNKDKKEDDFQRKSEEVKEKKSSDVVPLKKYLDKKLKIKDLERENSDLKTKLQSGNNSFNSKDLESLAEEFGANPEALKKLASILTPKQNADLEEKIAKLEKSNEQLLAKEQRREDEKIFDKKFKEKFGNVPALKEKKSLFKQVWFSPTFPELKTLEDIKNAFFPHIKVDAKTSVKKESLEEGSGGSNKGAKVIDFSKMSDEQHMEVLKDPELKAKYYAWLDARS